MSVAAIPLGDTLEKLQAYNADGLLPDKSIKKARTLVAYKYQGNEDLSKIEFPTESLSPYSCDPLLRFINLADFEDDKQLQRNFEQVLRIRKMGFPVKILKQNWFPGLICIPVFHCQRCLALWTEAARVPTLCSEVNRSVYGRMLPISVTKCDLLTRLFTRDQTGGRGTTMKSPGNVETSVGKTENSEAGKLENKQKFQTKTDPVKKLKQPPVAEFVDIEEEIRKIREKVLRGNYVARQTTMKSRKGDEQCTEDKPTNFGLSETSVVDSFADERNSKRENDGIKEDVRIDTEELAGEKVKARSAALEKTGKSSRAYHRGRTSSICSRRSEVSGCFARPSSRASQIKEKKQFYGGLCISSKHKDEKREGGTGNGKKTDKWTNRHGRRRETEGATKLNRSSGLTTTVEISRDEAESAIEDEIKELNGEVDEDGLRKRLNDFTDQEKWTTKLNERSFGFDTMTKPIYMRLFKWDVTRAFCFSYFSLVRKVKKRDSYGTRHL